MPNLLPPPLAGDTALLSPDQLTGTRQHLAGVSEAAMRGFESDAGRQEREARERIRTDLESHISTSFDVTTTVGHEQASAYVRYEMHRTRHEVTTLELRMSDVQARRLRLSDELATQQPPSETREAIAQELRSMSLTVRELNSQLEELRSLGARLQIQRQQQELQEFMTAGRDPRPQPFPVLRDHRPSPPLPTDPPNPPLSSPVSTPSLLPPIDLSAHMESGSRPARVSNVTRRVYHDRSVPDPMLLANRASDISQSFSFEYPLTPINDENDPGLIVRNSRQAPSSNRSSQRRPLDRVPLNQLDDSHQSISSMVDTVEENDDRYLNEMLPPSQRPSTSTNVIAPQGSPAEVEAMLMATSSDEDEEPRFDSRNARRRQFRTQSPAMVMRTRITGEQQVLPLGEPYSSEERHPGSPLVPGGRPATPVGPPVSRQPPLELRGAGTPVFDVEMQETSPVRVNRVRLNPLLVPPSAIVRDPRAPLSIRARRRGSGWYPQDDPVDLPPLDLPSWPVLPVSPHGALNRYMTSGSVQAAWDALWESDTTTGPGPLATRVSLNAVRNVSGTQFPGPRTQPKEYVKPAGKSIREWIEEREKALAGESRSGIRPPRCVTVEEFPSEEA